MDQDDVDYLTLGETARQLALQFETQAGWEEYMDKDGTTMKSLVVDKVPLKAYLLTRWCPDLPPSDFAFRMWEFKAAQWQAVTSKVEDFKVVEELQAFPSNDWPLQTPMKICYQINKLPFPLWNRDTVALWTMFDEGNGSYRLVATSIEDDRHPVYTKQYVRNQLFVSSFLLTPEKGGTLITRIMHVNPMGQIPRRVINYGAAKLHSAMAKLEQMVRATE